MSTDLPLPIPTGGATSTVGAPADTSPGVSASAPAGGQGVASVFDALMAVLGPVAVSADANPDDAAVATASAPVQPTTDVQANAAAAPVAAQPVATAILPQLVVNLQSVQPEPVAAVLPATATKPADKADVAAADANPGADASAAEAPAQLSPAVDVAVKAQAVVPAAPGFAEPATSTMPQDAPAAAPVRATGPKAKADDRTPADAKADDTDGVDTQPAPVSADVTVPPVVVAQLQVPSQPQAQATAQAQTTVQTPAPPQRRSSVQAPAQAALSGAAGVPAPTAADATTTALAASAPDRPNAPDTKASDTTVADAGAPQATAPSTEVPVPPQPRPADALAGSLKAVRKALATDTDGEGPQATPRSTASSGFSLQAQVEAPGAYTATGAQTAGTTEAGSNLARATVETLSNMAVQVNRKLSEGNSKFAVELHPADLGKVEVTLSIARDGTTTAHLKFDTPVTAAAFQAQEGELRQQLAQTGLNLDSGALTFSSRDDNSAGFNQAFTQMQQQNQPQGQQNQQSKSQARAFKNAQAIAADADASAAVDAGLLAQRTNVPSTLALNLFV